MVTALQFALAVTLLSCQQADRRDSPGEVAATLPFRRDPLPTPDPEVRLAQIQLAEGRPSLASRTVMPVLRLPDRRTPEALLVAARAAAEWHGWDLVKSILAYEPWIATRFDGEALELLARSALERDDAAEARARAEAALRVPASPSARALRLVLLARALDRLDERDTAAATYRRAADALPVAREWLLLRAAGATKDGRARERLYAMIHQAPVKERVAYTEAQTLERFGQDLSAAAAYDKLGDIPSSYRLRFAADYDAAQKSGALAGLLGYIQRDARGDNLARALEVLDAAFPRLDATSQLLATRRAAAAGLNARAVAGFGRVPAAALTDADVIAWARALSATNKPTDAAARIAAHRFAPAAAPEAAYVRALAQVRSGRVTAGRAALAKLVASAGTSRVVPDAQYLLADLETDAGRDARARDLLESACKHQPAGGHSDESCFRAGILNFALGSAKRAAAAFDELRTRFPASPDVTAATYWSGRAWERLGNAARARERWAHIIAHDPLSYYAAVASQRLPDSSRWTPESVGLPRSPLFQSAMARASALEQLGMETEEKFEYDAIEGEAAENPATALGAGAALIERGQAPRAIRLGWKIVATARPGRDTSTRDERGYALIYPVLHEVELIARAHANNLDPALVAAVIRQESSWNPTAVSPAGARGLMQIMPTVGEAIARSRKYPMWDSALLFDPDVSLELGTAHLAAALSAYDNLPRALAAYNAGASRVQRWNKRTGASDTELFIERIPFVETRDYVRIVMRNVEMYRALHGLKK